MHCSALSVAQMTLRQIIGQERDGASVGDEITTNTEATSDCPIDKENCMNQIPQHLQPPNVYQGAVCGFTNQCVICIINLW